MSDIRLAVALGDMLIGMTGEVAKAEKMLADIGAEGAGSSENTIELQDGSCWTITVRRADDEAES